MAALVADYGSDSTSDDSEDDNEETSAEINLMNDKNKEVSLIPADVILDQAVHGQRGSIFSNPFLEAEKCQQDTLEKHVKMTNVKELEVKGKNICYKFQKGKCPFGSKCKYYHPQSIPSPNEALIVMDNSTSILTALTNERDDDDDTEANRPKKKRYGLKDTLQPPKGYIKMYNKQKRN